MQKDKVIPVIVGIDVGGTNTDAVVLCKASEKPIASIKELTTHDITTGVRNAILKVLKEATSKGHRLSVIQVNIGTTHFVNAIVQGKGLAKVSFIRLCGSSSGSL